jgi:Family of unknown function (DUF6516)
MALCPRQQSSHRVTTSNGQSLGVMRATSVGLFNNTWPCCPNLQHEGGGYCAGAHILAEDAFVEIVVWRVPRSVKDSTQRLKYRLALVEAGECVLRYDNEADKSDRRHVGGLERTYSFSTYNELVADFWTDVDEWRHPR